MNKWLTIKEAAQRFGITSSSLHEWLAKHPAIKVQYCGWRRLPKKKPMLVLREEALLVIANIKNNFYGNKSSKARPCLLEQGKKKLAEQLLKTSQIQGMTAEEALLKAVQLLVEHGHRIQAIEKKIKLEKPMASLPAPATQHGALRPLLCQRINSYANDIGAEHRDLWTLLYRQFAEKYGVDLQEVAERTGQKPLDIAEKDGHILPLYQLAAQLYRSHRALTV